MRPDLQRVEERLLAETALEFPLVGDILRGLIASGGKRLRPLLLLLAAKPFRYEVERLVPAAAGIELLHTASLIHDDSIDGATLRRGQPTLNALFDSSVVIMVGDYLFARSAMLAASTMNPRVLAVFARCLGSICDGQLRELFAARRTDLSFDDYQRRIYGKTASLFAGSAEIGAILADAADDQIEALREFGGALGMAFQIVDDILDFRGQTGELGKPAGQDLRQGTVTLPTMIFLTDGKASPEERQFVEHLIRSGSPDDDAIATAVRLVRDSGALDEAHAIARQYVETAKNLLADLPPSDERAMLVALAEHAIARRA
ncbi:MAG: polyprenyl synthetase family protein [Thermomicrobium sp.]|nr:polyprenyl synthetase family protein [Thermomicrobium sp.]